MGTQVGSFLGGSGGLFGAGLSAAPTQASTGLTAWMNQPTSSTVANSLQGVTVTTPSQASANNLALLVAAAPAAPYKIKVLIACYNDVNTNAGMLFGFAHGTTNAAPVQAICWKPTWTTSADAIGVINYNSSLNSFNAAAVAKANPYFGGVYWFQIADDGTNVTFSMSPTGDPESMTTLYTVAKAAGFLGASGYTNIVFGAVGFAGFVVTELLSWKIS